MRGLAPGIALFAFLALSGCGGAGAHCLDGQSYRNELTGLSLDFKQGRVRYLGLMEFKYRCSGDEVKIESPEGNLVLKLDGDILRLGGGESALLGLSQAIDEDGSLTGFKRVD